MDINNDSPMALSKAFPDFEGKEMVAGAKQLRRAITSGRASHVYLAQNADPAITDSILNLCQCNQIAFTWVPNMRDLGKACGIDVGTAAAAAVK